MEMEDIILRVSGITGIPVSDIISRKKTRGVCEARQLFIYLSFCTFGKSHTDIALFINRTRQDISSQLIDFENRLKIYRRLKSRISEIENMILTP
jgi:chromosomal replication initiation ATPase DnaA